MKHIPDDIIEGAADAIISARDFCGNEKLAAYEHAAEAGLGDTECIRVIALAMPIANARWNEFRKAARRAAR